MSGSYPDIAADWTQLLPNHDDTDGYHVTSGTSFATPRTAGILSLVITMLREDAGDMLSGASEEYGRNGSLVSSGNAPITNADIRARSEPICLVSKFRNMGPNFRDYSNVTSCTLHTGWMGSSQHVECNANLQSPCR